MLQSGREHSAFSADHNDDGSYDPLDDQYDYLRSVIEAGHDTISSNPGPLPATPPAVYPTRADSAIAGSAPRVHSLTMAITMALSSTPPMTAMMAPDSPPELTSSKSSKSSHSFRSSIPSETNSPERLSHFEDIALADSGRDSYELQVSERKPVVVRPTVRRIHSSGPRKNGTTMYDLHSANPKKHHQTSPPARVNGVLRETSGNLPMAQRVGLKRGFSSPSSPQLGSMPARTRMDSRSPSPTSPGPRSRSPHSIRSGRNSFGNNFGTAPTRRESWQPGRKSLKELEAEYHDSDDDLPEDAVIWNVPISPRPPFQGCQAGPASVTPSSPRSQSNLRHEESSIPQSVAHGKAGPSKIPPNLRASPRGGRRPGMHHSATAINFPVDAVPYKSRAKSWTDDLSDEARALSAALDAHAARTKAENESSTPQTPPRPDMSKMRAKTTVVELPPLRKGDVMVDPLPVSKEKEAVLARTRPSWLPPKCKKEERKHLKEWEKMMQRSAVAEQKREVQKTVDVGSAKENEGSIARIWEQHVIPNWDVVIHEPRTRELWWRGVTPKDRGTVWAKAIGNELHLSEASYMTALQRAKALEAKVSQMSAEDKEKSAEAHQLSAIAADVPTVFPDLCIFSRNSPLHETLHDVLAAYAAYRSDTPYDSAIAAAAGLLVLNMQPALAFVALANLLNRPLPSAHLTHDAVASARFHAMVLVTLKHKVPMLHAHLVATFADGPAAWLQPMFASLFARYLHAEAASRVWDVYVFEGDKALVRAAVGVLMLLEHRLYGSRDEVLAVLGAEAPRWPVGGSEEDFVKAVREAGKTAAP